MIPMFTRAFTAVNTYSPALFEHVENYAALASVEAQQFADRLRRQFLMLVLAVAAIFASALLAGVAGLMWAMQNQRVELLLFVPIGFAVLGVALFILSRPASPRNAFPHVRAQLREDIRLSKQAFKKS